MNAIQPTTFAARQAMTLVLVLTHDAGVVEMVAAALSGLAQVHRADPVEDAAQLAVIELRPSLLMLDVADLGEALPPLLATLRRGAPGAAIIALGDENAPELILTCLRAGAMDFLARQTGEVTLRRALRTMMERGGREASAHGQGPAFVLFGARPGDPSRMVALALALQRAQAGHRVLFLDLAPGARETEIALDITARYGVSQALEDLDRLDQALLSSAAAKHAGSGLFLLLLQEGQAPEALPPVDLNMLLSVLRAVYDEVVVNAPVALLAAIPAIVGGLRRFGLVGTQSLASAQAAAEALRRLAAAGVTPEDRALLVVAEHDARIMPKPEALATSVGLSQALALPDGRARLCNAVNLGRFAEDALSDRAFARQVMKLGRELGAAEGAAEAPSLLQRLRLMLKGTP